ncbi:hypothetical protein DFS34DRAFT_451587 [Phlyctochytrium arcticum]|nr:hypothetical protein DFS34DRAFT_451587 [Phlyctochytrium arcticum]
MNELDLLLRELDTPVVKPRPPSSANKTGDERKGSNRDVRSDTHERTQAQTIAGTGADRKAFNETRRHNGQGSASTNLPHLSAQATHSHGPRSEHHAGKQGINELDNLVKDLTDLRGLVGGSKANVANVANDTTQTTPIQGHPGTQNANFLPEGLPRVDTDGKRVIMADAGTEMTPIRSIPIQDSGRARLDRSSDKSTPTPQRPHERADDVPPPQVHSGNASSLRGHSDATNQLDKLMGDLSMVAETEQPSPVDAGMPGLAPKPTDRTGKPAAGSNLQSRSGSISKHRNEGQRSSSENILSPQEHHDMAQPPHQLEDHHKQRQIQTPPDESTRDSPQRKPPPLQDDSFTDSPANQTAQNQVRPSGPRFCSACKEPLQGPAVSALGKHFHPEHFNCHMCKKQLGHGRFFEKVGDAYCEACWQSQLPKCAYCSGPILERCVTALGQHWHPDHFFCAQCGKLFPPGAGFLEKDGMAYCEEDYFNLFAMRCGGCSKGIVGEFVSACGKEWHVGCFVCADCKEPFPTGTFYEHYGQPYCSVHHQLRRTHGAPMAADPY